MLAICASLSHLCGEQTHPKLRSFDIDECLSCCKPWCPISDVGRDRFNRVMRRNCSSRFSSACFCSEFGGQRNWYETCCSHPRPSERMEDRVRGIVSIKQGYRLLADLLAPVTHSSYGRRKSEHYQPYPNWNLCLEQFV